MQRYPSRIVGVLAIGLFLPAVAWCRGKRPDYVTTGSEDRPVIRPVRRGSAANPNPAFTPPKFDSDRSQPAVIPTAKTPSAIKPESQSGGSDNWTGTSGNATTAPPNSPSSVSPPTGNNAVPTMNNAPPPAAKPSSVTGSDSSEPPLPDNLGQDNGGSGIHPPAH